MLKLLWPSDEIFFALARKPLISSHKSIKVKLNQGFDECISWQGILLVSDWRSKNKRLEGSGFICKDQEGLGIIAGCHRWETLDKVAINCLAVKALEQ